MADGDEKIDHNDRVILVNRVVCSCPPAVPGQRPPVCTAATTVKFDGKDVTWPPGGKRTIQKDEAGHYLLNSEIRKDPSGAYFPVRRLVMVDEAGAVVEDGADATPMTEALCQEIAKSGLLDTSNLPPDRILGGNMLIDPETGEHPTGTALRGNPTGRDISAPPLKFAPAVSDRDLAGV